jgi:hypothetical protein
MVIHNLNVVSVPLAPPKTYPPLIVDANTVLTFAVSRQLSKSIARGDAKVIQPFCGVEYRQFAPSYAM